MEKIVATKLEKPVNKIQKNIKKSKLHNKITQNFNKFDKNNKTKNKKEQNTKQNKHINIVLTNVKMFFKKHGKLSGIIVSIFVLFFIVLFFTFVNSSFYQFINRPKILQNSTAIIFLLLLSGFLCIADFFVNLLYLYKLNYVNNTKKYIKNYKIILKKCVCNLKPSLNLQKTKFKKLNTCKQKKQIKYSYKKIKRRSSKFDVLKLNIYMLVLFLLLCLSFKIKVLWLCVCAVFAICVLNVNLIICNKTKQSKVLNCLMLLLNICNFLSFYLIYMLN